MQPIENHPSQWSAAWPWPKANGNKYDRGHVIVSGGGIRQTGAARLAAISALRIGAGLVSVACDRESLPVYATSLTAVMTKLAEDSKAYQALVDDPRHNVFLIGPGSGVSDRTREQVQMALAAKKSTVLDADALTVYSHAPQTLFAMIQSPCVMTPHEGEFARLFGSKGGDKLTRATEATRLSGAVILLKGNETVIAAPDGRISVNRHATPDLATAGSGDVLAGLIAGLLAQGMEAFMAACAAAWVHGEAAAQFGSGLIAEDLPPLIPNIIQTLKEAHYGHRSRSKN